ncbi:helix-turn-helix domain-containing protein [Paenisporosarcina quisquiliarum]|uniref:Helix-turn-helix domain-containing protein n=1 Tax=Paenisporosarcina quisquiliarum TaxID=365346 RepID=A0A9X3RFF9_9BACL|nr:helix-turn-helix transcriptional regulator [Paenisporosarcina quisquiliarum]MCZ8538473.1 helix-turn-helix domain-containing protein [Paenisporosarcina quisquiliarum]
MNNIGLLIKMSRIQQNMKQVTLAKGICSTSYLSKIENNQTIPSEDVLQLLLDRLNLDYEDLSMEQETEFLSELYLLYKDAIINRNKEDILVKLNSYKERNFLFKDESNFFTYNLYLFRLFLITETETEILLNLKEALDQMNEKFDDRQYFLFNLNSGILLHVEQQFKVSLQYFENGLDLITAFHLDEWEIADFYNALSISYLSNNHFLNTIEYSTKALNFYKDNLIFKRAIDCYIVIGIAQTLTAKYKSAEESYLLAKKLTNDLNFKEYEGIITQNLGFCYAQKNNHDKAIEYYIESLNSMKDTEGYLLTIFSIVKEYSKQNKIEKILEWCKKGFELLEANPSDKTHSYYYHFMIYSIMHENDIKDENLYKSSIEHFENTKDYRYANKYAIKLANLYSSNRKYKNSALTYQKAIEYQFLQKSITYLEEL